MKNYFITLGAVLTALVLVFLGGLYILALLAVSLGESGSPAESLEGDSFLVLDLSCPIVDHVADDRKEIIYSLYRGDYQSPVGLNDILRAIESAARDPRIDGISLEGEGFGGGSAQLEEIRQGLERFRLSGKPVMAYAQTYTQGDYLLKSVADSVFIHPLGSIDLKGLSWSVAFYKDFISKYGIGVQVFRSGKFKAAVEPFLEGRMSEENRLQMEELLTSIWDTLTVSVADSRGLDPYAVGRIAADLACGNAQDALRLGLADDILYEDQYRGLWEENFGSFYPVELSGYLKNIKKKKSSSDRIAVIYAQGEILSQGGSSGYEITEESVAESFDKALSSPRIKAIVLRIDSPGGNIFPSENILRIVKRAREEKPVVVSMGNYAASGGYYIACGADYIFAEPSTLTGSIGVFGLMFNAEKLGENLGITSQAVSVYPSSRNPGLLTPATGAQSRLMQQQVEEAYRTFVERVAEGRGMEVEQVEKIAQGRVYSGIDAQKAGLVDSLGGIGQAVSHAARLAEIEGDYSVVELPRTSGKIDWLTGLFSFSAKGIRNDDNPAVRYSDLYLRQWESLQRHEGIQARLPLGVEWGGRFF